MLAVRQRIAGKRHRAAMDACRLLVQCDLITRLQHVVFAVGKVSTGVKAGDLAKEAGAVVDVVGVRDLHAFDVNGLGEREGGVGEDGRGGTDELHLCRSLGFHCVFRKRTCEYVVVIDEGKVDSALSSEGGIERGDGDEHEVGRLWVGLNT
ncbi:hypothetical protein ABW21_db0202926 [Orbilia brochopaga]|nr:hypothetical protein ABW21_db0202926 [Drechslerella brochopaga]